MKIISKETDIVWIKNVWWSTRLKKMSSFDKFGNFHSTKHFKNEIHYKKTVIPIQEWEPGLVLREWEEEGSSKILLIPSMSERYKLK